MLLYILICLIIIIVGIFILIVKPNVSNNLQEPIGIKFDQYDEIMKSLKRIAVGLDNMQSTIVKENGQIINNTESIREISSDTYFSRKHLFDINQSLRGITRDIERIQGNL